MNNVIDINNIDINNVILVIGGLALVGIAYYCYKNKKTGPIAHIGIIDGLVLEMNAEKVDKLSMSDVVNYFKSLRLRKGVDTPFVATSTNDGIKSYLLGTFNEGNNKLENTKLITPSSIDDELAKLIGNERIVVLS